MADIIRVFSATPPTELADGVAAYLSRLDAVSTYWPSDKEITTALATEAAYRRYRRGRLRVLLEA
ncbi:hypothetical protein, partial [Sedimentibacter sp. B4]|uniref:hypothetical protein n=1 Tax=Sedimentibacter sp. B4 TaxID=304766 RepID=UPI001E4B5C77